ncbi:hypothetical protein CRENBAI_022777 [Crenichthys baileyi]|uniref:Uncharacterized protein n=1 Tax=Crenichthys baileyi TaxID=28760 RepID=A0AAV9S3H4_9TELE
MQDAAKSIKREKFVQTSWRSGTRNKPLQSLCTLLCKLQKAEPNQGGCFDFAGSRDKEASSHKGRTEKTSRQLKSKIGLLMEMRKRKRGSTLLQNPPSHCYNPDEIGEMVRQQGQR